MTAIMSSGITSDKFLYYGFLPANRDERIQELRRVRNKDKTDMIFLDTPYRLKKLLLDMKTILGKERQAIIAYKLTQPEEKVFWGNLEELCIMTEDLPKGEFVIILKKRGKKRRR
jgi:16S rRNA (cytidine1402-2'-O)-methyltransferase